MVGFSNGCQMCWASSGPGFDAKSCQGPGSHNQQEVVSGCGRGWHGWPDVRVLYPECWPFANMEVVFTGGVGDLRFQSVRAPGSFWDSLFKDMSLDLGIHSRAAQDFDLLL
mmetsp:Transcript_7776/g.28458  ORF Transcript_7776/g.28458 Transcript_7776/m.28458 type:complete len:111 (+) Transcript_7776:639-971(+)